MPLRHHLRSWLLACLLGLAGLPAAAAAPRLLLLVEVLGAAPWYTAFIEALRVEVRAQHPDVLLDVEVMASEPLEPLPAWLVDKYADQRYDMVLACSPALVSAAARLRDHLWPGATLVLAAPADGQRSAAYTAERLVGVLAPDVTMPTLDLIFRLAPDTQHVAVIATSLEDDQVRAGWHRSLDWLKARAQLIDLSGLTLAQLRKRIAQLPPRTAIYFAAPGLPVVRSVTTPRDFVTELVEAGVAPVFVDASTMFGTGAVGGALLSPESMAQDVARQVRALLAGAAPGSVGFQPMTPPAVTTDWRALQRWHFSQDRLPPGSVLIGQPPGLWEAYRAYVLVAAAVVIMQSALIAALLLERRRRQRAELKARQHLSDLARLNRGTALGALSAALAHEISQPLGAIQAHAETAELLLGRPGEPRRDDELRELLSAIREDDERAAAVLQRLRAWIGNAPGELRPTALNPLVTGVARLLQTELHLRETELELVLGPSLPQVSADALQVQQVVLNLVLNALDALQSVPARQRRVVVSTSEAEGGWVAVGVRDNGPGLAGVTPERLFEPFFTTKREGLGVGLAISRSIIERHRGQLRVADTTEGAYFLFTLPVVRGPAQRTRRGVA